MAKKNQRSNQPPAKYLPQSLSDDEFVACAIELGQRLSRHLDALESGEPGAVADVASVLRTLVVRGDGDDVIRRLCTRMNVVLPQVLVSQAAHDGPLVILAVGAMPVAPEDADYPHQISTKWVNLNGWSDMKALVIRDGIPHRVNSWNRVIALYANTFGSHLSGTIPDVLNRTSEITSGKLDLGQYLIHCAGIVAESSLNQVLTEVVGQAIIVPHRPGRQLNRLSHLTLWDDGGKPLSQPPFEFSFMPTDIGMGETVDVLKLHFADRYIKASFARHPDDKIYGTLNFSQKKPDWWDTA
jgi:hypothetical protein